jgi:hypothetical protein
MIVLARLSVHPDFSIMATFWHETSAGRNFSVLRRENTVVDYCGVEVYLHAFSAKALDGDVPVNSTSDGYYPAKRPQVP